MLSVLVGQMGKSFEVWILKLGENVNSLYFWIWFQNKWKVNGQFCSRNSRFTASSFRYSIWRGSLESKMSPKTIDFTERFYYVFDQFKNNKNLDCWNRQKNVFVLTKLVQKSNQRFEEMGVLSQNWSVNGHPNMRCTI